MLEDFQLLVDEVVDIIVDFCSIMNDLVFEDSNDYMVFLTSHYLEDY